MKQFTFVVEVLIQDNSDLFLVRDPRSGMIVKSTTDSSDLVLFLDETVEKFKNASNDEGK